MADDNYIVREVRPIGPEFARSVSQNAQQDGSGGIDTTEWIEVELSKIQTEDVTVLMACPAATLVQGDQIKVDEAYRAGAIMPDEIDQGPPIVRIFVTSVHPDERGWTTAYEAPTRSAATGSFAKITDLERFSSAVGFMGWSKTPALTRSNHFESFAWNSDGNGRINMFLSTMSRDESWVIGAFATADASESIASQIFLSLDTRIPTYFSANNDYLDIKISDEFLRFELSDSRKDDPIDLGGGTLAGNGWYATNFTEPLWANPSQSSWGISVDVTDLQSRSLLADIWPETTLWTNQPITIEPSGNGRLTVRNHSASTTVELPNLRAKDGLPNLDHVFQLPPALALALITGAQRYPGEITLLFNGDSALRMFLGAGFVFEFATLNKS